MARTIWFSAYPFINKVFTPDDPRNYLRSIRSLPLPLQVKNRITLFPFSDILKPVHGYFFRRYFSDFFVLYLLQANTFSSFWTGSYKNEKSSLVLGPTFSRKIESRFGPYVFEKNRVSFFAVRFRGPDLKRGLENVGQKTRLDFSCS